MSRSPQDEQSVLEMQNPDSAFRLHLDRVNQMISDGGSLSGHERNCAFLNTRSGKFASIFAVSGLDFDDDARSPAVVDWDNDGDLDLWVTNRTAPQVRFLRNDSPKENRFLAIQLQGTRSNRDAIGARVEVMLEGQPPLIKTLHAGDGFLSQSTKWLHFGLGTASEIKEVTIRWPSGGEATYSQLQANQRYKLIEGSETPFLIDLPQPSKSLTPSRLPAPPLYEHPRVVLSARMPMPPLRYPGYPDQQQKLQIIPLGDGKPVLVNLWASWCAPCIAELKEWSDRETELRKSGVRIFAISLDELDSNETNSAKDAEHVLNRVKFPFDWGIADEKLKEQLHQSYQWPFSRHLNMPVPTSFLLDGEGRLAVIYRGRVDTDQLLQDILWVQNPQADLMAAALPFPGRWHDQPKPQLPIRAAVELMDDNNLLDAAVFFQTNRELLWRHPEFALLAVWIGDEFVKIGQVEKAITFYRDAINRDPSDLTVMNNLAWQFGSHSDPRIRNPEQAVFWAEKANSASRGGHPSVLATLAVAYASAGRFDEAQNTAAKAKEIAVKAEMPELVKKLSDRIELFRQKKPFYQ